jgi:epoxyqueuosine reductase
MANRLFLHICCAPCLIAPLRHLREESAWQVEGFWFNPNLHPYTEYRKRMETLHDFVARVVLPMHWHDDYALEMFLKTVAPAPDLRCESCYRIRLRETAKQALELHFDAFSSTLLYSRYQKHDLIVAVAREAAQEFGVSFYYEDFRVFWDEGNRLSREDGMYRQPYCGCIYSEKERYYKGPKF